MSYDEEEKMWRSLHARPHWILRWKERLETAALTVGLAALLALFLWASVW